MESEEDDAGAQELFRGEVDAVGGRCWQPDDVGQEYAKHDRDNERADSRQQQADPVRCSGRGEAEDKPGQQRADSGKQRVFRSGGRNVLGMGHASIISSDRSCE